MTRIWNKHKQPFDSAPSTKLGTSQGRANTPLKRKVFVAMSGGVDSSVAAALLKRQGFNIVGVYMKPYQPKAGISNFQFPISKQIPNSKFLIQNSDFCLWRQDREDALRAAAVLDIPLLTWDFSKEYKKYVTDYMLRGYEAGRTPNPDVMCNKEIKFGLFFKKAMKEGADYIATGHYVRLRRNDQFRISNFEFDSKLKIKNSKFSLWQAKDFNKDQTYFLWTLTQKHLAKTLFPIGDYVKPEVRKLAKKFGLPNHDKKDSQGVCFIGPLDMKNFLKNYIKPKMGKVLLLKDNPSAGSGHSNRFQTIGMHDGVYYYTIGQRHGLNLGLGGGPYFVVKKDIKKNIIFVGTEKDLTGRKARITNINWISGTPSKFPVELSVRTRYRAPLKKALLKKNGELIFKQPERAITSGQSAVFYKGQELLGGGVISE